jgi:hypothetical protein
LPSIVLHINDPEEEVKKSFRYLCFFFLRSEGEGGEGGEGKQRAGGSLGRRRGKVLVEAGSTRGRGKEPGEGLGSAKEAEGTSER